MLFARPSTRRLLLASLCVSPLLVSMVQLACSVSSGTPPAATPDASSCATSETCRDANNPFVPGSDAAPEEDATPDDAGPEDATIDHAALADTGSADATDAGDASDAALAADVDQNCTHYATPPTIAPASIRVTNGHGSPVYLGITTKSCDRGLFFTLKDTAQTSFAVAQKTSELTCSQLQTQCPGTPQCDGLFVTKLEPGKYYEIPWTGTIFMNEPMPAKCYADAGCHAASCVQEFTAPAGTLTVATTVYTTPLCGDAGATPCAVDCTAGSSGTCTVPGATLVGGTALTGSATWSSGQSIVVVNVP